MAGFSKIVCAGKEIFVVDYQGLNEEQMKSVITQAKDAILSEKREVRLLVNITNAFATPGFMSVAYEVAKAVRPYMLKGAILGASGAKTILLRTYNALSGDKLIPFASHQEAMQHLSS